MSPGADELLKATPLDSHQTAAVVLLLLVLLLLLLMLPLLLPPLLSHPRLLHMQDRSSTCSPLNPVNDSCVSSPLLLLLLLLLAPKHHCFSGARILQRLLIRHLLRRF